MSSPFSAGAQTSISGGPSVCVLLACAHSSRHRGMHQLASGACKTAHIVFDIQTVHPSDHPIMHNEHMHNEHASDHPTMHMHPSDHPTMQMFDPMHQHRHRPSIVLTGTLPNLLASSRKRRRRDSTGDSLQILWHFCWSARVPMPVPMPIPTPMPMPMPTSSYRQVSCTHRGGTHGRLVDKHRVHAHAPRSTTHIYTGTRPCALLMWAPGVAHSADVPEVLSWVCLGLSLGKPTQRSAPWSARGRQSRRALNCRGRPPPHPRRRGGCRRP